MPQDGAHNAPGLGNAEVRGTLSPYLFRSPAPRGAECCGECCDSNKDVHGRNERSWLVWVWLSTMHSRDATGSHFPSVWELREYELGMLPALFKVGCEARQVSAGKEVCQGTRCPLLQQCLSLYCPLLTKLIIGPDHTEKKYPKGPDAFSQCR